MNSVEKMEEFSNNPSILETHDIILETLTPNWQQVPHHNKNYILTLLFYKKATLVGQFGYYLNFKLRE